MAVAYRRCTGHLIFVCEIGLPDSWTSCVAVGNSANVDTLESAISTITKRERYGYCAKCLKPKSVSTDYVCHDCVGTPGRYAGCAVCGLAWDEERACCVCWADLVADWQSPTVRRRLFAAAKLDP